MTSASRTAARTPRDDRLSSSAATGSVVHAAVAVLVMTAPMPLERNDRRIDAAVDDVIARWALCLRRGVRAAVVTAVAIFVHELAAVPPWRYVDVEANLGHAVADQLVTDGSRWRIDELKTGSLVPPAARLGLGPQISAQLRDGSRIWGPRFAGVRVVSITDRASTLIVDEAGLLDWLAGGTRPGSRRAAPAIGRSALVRVSLRAEQQAAVDILGSARLAWLLTGQRLATAAPYEAFRAAAQGRRRGRRVGMKPVR